MSFGPLGIWEILVIVGVALLIFGPAQLPKIARGVGKAFKTAKDMKDEVTGVVLGDEDAESGSKTRKRRPAEAETSAEDSNPAAGAQSLPPPSPEPKRNDPCRSEEI